MLFGLGLDLVRVSRMESAWRRFGDRFLTRCFTGREVAEALARPNPAQALAMRFAAKEAFSKAAGLGMRGLGWRDIEVGHDQNGKPVLNLHGRAMDWMTKNQVASCHLSLTDDGEYAAAVVVLEKI